MKWKKNDRVVLIFLTLVLSFAGYNRLSDDDRIFRVITSDALGYYQYLPAVFISHEGQDAPTDLNTLRKNELVDLKNLFWSTPLQNGNRLNVFQYGTALLQLPFFLMAFLLSLAGLFPLTGYEEANFWFVAAATLFYALCSFYLLKKVLSVYYSSLISWAVVLFLFAGTSAFYYTVAEPGASHIYSFFCASGLLYGCSLFYESGKIKGIWIAALFLGLLFAIRPYNIIMAVFPFMWGVNNMNLLSERISLILKSPAFFSFLLFPLLFFLPQMAYWYYVSGKFLLFSYGEGGQGFTNWKSPFLFSVLFSIQNGFLIYAPVVVFAIAGLLLGYRKKEVQAWPVLTALIVAWYLFASWWAWWFGGAFGHRAFIDYLPLMAFPFAWLLSRISGSGKKQFITVMVICCLCVFYTTRLSYQYIPPWDGEHWTVSSFLYQVKQAFTF